MTFFHASPELLDVVKPTKTGRDGTLYACVATTVEQAVYWAGILYGSREVKVEDFVIHEVFVPYAEYVEDCVGHYRIERYGCMKVACDVRPHEDVDGEVCIFAPATVVRAFRP